MIMTSYADEREEGGVLLLPAHLRRDPASGRNRGQTAGEAERDHPCAKHTKASGAPTVVMASAISKIGPASTMSAPSPGSVRLFRPCCRRSSMRVSAASRQNRRPGRSSPVASTRSSPSRLRRCRAATLRPAVAVSGSRSCRRLARSRGRLLSLKYFRSPAILPSVPMASVFVWKVPLPETVPLTVRLPRLP